MVSRSQFVFNKESRNSVGSNREFCHADVLELVLIYLLKPISKRIYNLNLRT